MDFDPALAAALLGAFLLLPASRAQLSTGILRGSVQDEHRAKAAAVINAHDFAQFLLFEAPAAVTEPLNFAALEDIRRPLFSHRALSWTAIQYRVHGIDVTDSYQPGQPEIVPDYSVLDEVVIREGASLGTSRAYGSEIGLFLRNPTSAWHGAITTENTGALFAADNLPDFPNRGLVKRPQQFRWFTRDTAQAGGQLSRWADVFLSATGQWASQTVPQSWDGVPLNSRVLFGAARGRVRLRNQDHLDALYSGSRFSLSSWGFPTGLEALTGRRIGPSLYGVSGFENLAQSDRADLLQAGWSHQIPGRAGTLEIRYGYLTAHFDTRPNRSSSAPAQTDLLDRAASDAALSNLAVRTRHEIEAACEPGEFHLGRQRHSFAFGGGWELSHPQNRFQAPSGANLILADGVPAFIVHLNTPDYTRAAIASFAPYARDRISLGNSLTLDIAVVADLSRGSLPAQSSPAGIFAPARTFPSRESVISWNSLSPRAGLAAPVPWFPRIILRGSYARTYTPLAGRYLDFANPNGLSGLEYDPQTVELLRRFGGAYSSIAPALKRPYADEFNISLKLSLPWQSAFSVNLFRRDEKNRIAAVNIGVPPQAYHAVIIRDPGPDFISGTFDDQTLVVYAQDRATLGQDQYLLANPAGLRELNTGIVAAANTHLRYADIRVSFAAEKSFGPANPGNAIWENDPGIVGALYSDPNSLINATGHAFVDRAFAGKFEAASSMPASFGGFQVVNIINYFDGLPFARQLLVTGLAQGPFLVATTLRGSPEGGNRAEYVLNWNLRATRSFTLPLGKLIVSGDVLNVLNMGHKIVENDLSGPLFNRRPAIAIQPPRSLRIGVRWEF